MRRFGIYLLMALLCLVVVYLFISLVILISGIKKDVGSKSITAIKLPVTDSVTLAPDDKSNFTSPIAAVLTPLEYNIRIFPLLVQDETGSFNAKCETEITVKSNRNTLRIPVNIRNIHIQDAFVLDFYTRKPLEIKTVYWDKQNDIYLIHMEQPLNASHMYILRYIYSLKINKGGIGLYWESYVESLNRTRYSIISNLSPNYARTVFPCYDEPGFKTPFRVTIGRNNTTRTHSNSKIKITKDMKGMPGFVWDTYTKTVPMSTYLLAIMVTDFDNYTVTEENRFGHTIYGRSSILPYTKYTSTMVTKLVPIIEDLTGFHYELEQLDLMVVSDLKYAAMETWGLITFHESSCVVIQDLTSQSSLKHYATIAAHEVALQWFGNLVTPLSWSYVWLKEGFSMFFAYISMNLVEPSWDIDELFLKDSTEALTADALDNTYALLTPLKNTSGPIDIFHHILYIKSNSIVNMMYNFVGKDIFMDCIRNYIRAYAYGSAEQEHLWKIFDNVLSQQQVFPDHLSMTEIMHSWTYQHGFPILQINRNVHTGTIHLIQDRFHHDGPREESREMWHIPISWATQLNPQFNETKPKLWFSTKQMMINETSLRSAVLSDHWIFFNLKQTGFYRVNYDNGNWQLLFNDYKNFPPVIRAQIISDIFAMASGGFLDYNIAFHGASKLQSEISLIVWDIAITALKPIQVHFYNTSGFQQLMNILVDNVFRYVVNYTITNSHDEILNYACMVGNVECSRKALNYLRQRTSGKLELGVPKHLTYWVYCAGIRSGTDTDWYKLMDLYENNTLDKDPMTHGLGCYKKSSFLEKYLDRLTIDGRVTRELFLALLSVAANPYGARVALNYCEHHWNLIEDYGNESNTNLIGLITSLSNSLNTKEDLEVLKSLNVTKADEVKALKNAITKVHNNIMWGHRYKAAVGIAINSILHHTHLSS
ncbi:aminopeptidase N isoform X2 [Cephus cinctus]|nr:aminopeptidase N isoform X2 [Cephus cinctus]